MDRLCDSIVEESIITLAKYLGVLSFPICKSIIGEHIRSYYEDESKRQECFILNGESDGIAPTGLLNASELMSVSNKKADPQKQICYNTIAHNNYVRGYRRFHSL